MPDIVLVVEDEDIVREFTVAFLTDAGLSVTEAASADEALEILRGCSSDICLLLTDVRMPGTLDGLELARATLALWPHIKVIVTSGMFTRPSDSVPDGVDFLPKPWLPLDMLTKVMRAANRSRADRE